MSSNRIGRINDEIQKELSALLRTVKDPRVTDSMLTITHVDTTSDLRYARIYVSALNCPDEKGLLKGLKSAAGYLRHELGSRMRPALYPGAAILRGRLHRLWRTHSGHAEPRQARRSPERRYRAAGGSGGLSEVSVMTAAGEPAACLAAMDQRADPAPTCGPTATPSAPPPPCAAALRDAGQRRRICCPTRRLTATYAPYAAPYLAAADFAPAYVVVRGHCGAVSLLPENARPLRGPH